MTTPPEPTQEAVIAWMESMGFEWVPTEDQWYKVLPHKVGDFQGKGRGQYVYPELATFFYQAQMDAVVAVQAETAERFIYKRGARSQPNEHDLWVVEYAEQIIRKGAE